jgi:hypothetical protein
MQAPSCDLLSSLPPAPRRPAEYVVLDGPSTASTAGDRRSQHARALEKTGSCELSHQSFTTPTSLPQRSVACASQSEDLGGRPGHEVDDANRAVCNLEIGFPTPKPLAGSDETWHAPFPPAPPATDRAAHHPRMRRSTPRNRTEASTATQPIRPTSAAEWQITYQRIIFDKHVMPPVSPSTNSSRSSTACQTHRLMPPASPACTTARPERRAAFHDAASANRRRTRRTFSLRSGPPGPATRDHQFT